MSAQPAPSPCGALATTSCPGMCPGPGSVEPEPCGICPEDTTGYKVKFRVVGPEGAVCVGAIRVNGKPGPASMEDWVTYPMVASEYAYGTIQLWVSSQAEGKYCDEPPTTRHFSGSAAPVNGPAYVTIEVEEVQP